MRPLAGGYTPRPMPGPKRATNTLTVVMSIFLLAGAGMSAVFAVAAARTYRARNWVEVPCTILASSVESSSSGDHGTTYSVGVRYAYTFAGQSYTSDRYSFL